MFYHDHSFGITRLNVYVGEAAAYMITDDVEKDLINGTNLTGVNPGFQAAPRFEIPLVIQDRTFVDAAPSRQDPTWIWGTDPKPGDGNITGAVPAISGTRMSTCRPRTPTTSTASIRSAAGCMAPGSIRRHGQCTVPTDTSRMLRLRAGYK